MNKLREKIRYPFIRRSMWKVCGRRKVLTALLLVVWIGTSAMTRDGSPPNVSQSNPGDASLPSASELLIDMFDRDPLAEAQQVRAQGPATQRETPKYSATLPEAGADADESLMCLAMNIYWEARNQSVAGQLAVAQVTLNRVLDPRYGDNVCDVVYEHMQFSWYWDGKSDVPMEINAWERAYLIASAALDGSGHVELEGVTHYHAVYSRPFWRAYMVKVAEIDDHIFYMD